MAAPIVAVLAGDDALVGHGLAKMADFVTRFTNGNILGGDREAVMLPATPLTRDGIAVVSACDPVIVRKNAGRASEARARNQPSEAFQHKLNPATHCLERRCCAGLEGSGAGGGAPRVRSAFETSFARTGCKARPAALSVPSNGDPAKRERKRGGAQPVGERVKWLMGR